MILYIDFYKNFNILNKVLYGFQKSIWRKIKAFKKKNKKLTQEQLAEMIDIDPRNLCRIEVGASFVKAETLEKILKALYITTEQLFSNDHIKSNKELLDDIYKYIDSAKNDTKKLEKIHKIIRFIVFDE